MKIGFAAYYEELGRVGLVDECAPKGYKQVSISGREMREKLRAGEHLLVVRAYDTANNAGLAKVVVR